VFRDVKDKLKKHLSEKTRRNIRTVKRFITWPFYLGFKYYCPFCQTSFRRLLHFYGRDNIRCPRCNSIDRYRLLWLYLLSTNLINNKLKVLHFAPEAVLSQKFRKMANLDYITADLMVSYIDDVCVKPDHIMSVCDIKFPDNAFDVVICNHVLEHVPDDNQAMSEIHRVLKSGGWAVLQVPINNNIEITFDDPSITSESDRNKYYGIPHHLRLYGRDYKDKLESVGLKVKIDRYVKDIDPDLIEKYRLDPEEDIYIVTK